MRDGSYRPVRRCFELSQKKPNKTANAAKIAGQSVRVTGTALGAVLKWSARVLGTLFLILTVASLIVAFLFMVYVNQYIKPMLDLPDFDLALTSFVYYIDPETGEEVQLEQLYNTENRVWVDYEDIPQYLIEATIAIEDHRFYSHHGVDWKRTASAVVNMFIGMKDNFGGSTITQQLIKNLTNENEVTVKRKIVEIFRALEFERHFTKEQILEEYLNTIPLGQGCNGVKTAAQVYFGKEVEDLTLAQSACIIGITNATTAYNPYINPKKNKQRQEDVLFRMFELGMIDQKEYDDAVAEKLVFVKGTTADTSNSDQIQSYYVDQVIIDVRNDLMEQYGLSKQAATNAIYSSGYKIYIPIDIRIQNIMDEVFSNPDNIPKVVVNGPETPQASMVVMDPYTGNVLGMVGGVGEKEGAFTLNRATQTYRQPGSSIKPISVYSPALDMGMITPYSVLEDSPLYFDDNGKPWPKNYDLRYRGLMTATRAVELSDNAVAAKVVDMITPERAFNFATQNLGLTSLVRETTIAGKVYSDVNIAPMSLGGLTKGVSVEEMTAAYCAFVNDGVYTKPRTYTKVVDSGGNVVLNNVPESNVAMKEKTAYYMTYMLQSVVKQGTGTKAQLENMAVAGKTGTTTNDNDRWFVGYTPYYVGAVWFGFDEPQEINLEKSTNPALALWKMVMERAHEGLESKTFNEPEGLVKASFCLDSGMAPSEYCTQDVRGSRVAVGLFYPEDVPQQICTRHVPVMKDIVTGRVATPYCPETQLVQAALLNLKRWFPVPNVFIEDEQYTLRDYVPTVDPLTGEPVALPVYNEQTGYPGAIAANADGSPPANGYCPVHSQPTAPPVEPNEPTDPNLPVYTASPQPSPSPTP